MQLLPARPPALLAVCFASWCVAYAGTSCAQTAAPPKEKGPTYIDAERIEGVMDIEITASGKAELRQDDTTIFGEKIKRNQEFGRIDAEGGVRMEQGSDRFFGKRLRFDATDSTGVFDDATFIIRGDDKPARGSAERIEFLGKDHYRLHNGSFTTCEPGRDAWNIEAKELDLDYNEQVATVRNGKLRFLDTTVAVLPWFDYPLEKGRKSGFLAPGYTQSTRSGLELSAPYYWNIAPDRDATFTPRYLSKRGVQLQSEFRYIDPKYSGTASLELLPNDKTFGANRYGLSLVHQQVFSPQLFGSLNLNKVSDSRYFSDLFSKVQQTSQQLLPRDGLLTYNGAAFGTGYSLSAHVQNWQVLQDPLAPIVSPYARVPQINLSTGKGEIGGIADLALPAEYVRFTHPTLVEGSRIQMNPTISAPYLTPGYFITPKVGLHYASYNLDRTPNGVADKQTVAVPWVSLDAGQVFERDAKFGGRDFTQTLEPRIVYVYAPYHNQDSVPVFDTGLATLNFSQLVSENRFSGGDRFGDANQMTVMATTRLLFPSGAEFLRASIGQRYYFSDQKVGLTPGTPLSTANTSDLLASFGMRMGQHWNLDTGTQYTVQSGQFQRIGMNLRYAPEFAKFVNLGYRYTRDPANPINQVDLSGQWPVKPGWFAVGRYNYSFYDGRLLEGIGGLEYNAGCWVARFIVQRLQVATQLATTSYFVQLELNDLAQLGSDPFEMLRRAVPGYTPTNTRTDQPLPSSLRRSLPFEQTY